MANWKLALRGVPWIPAFVLVTMVLVAIFADFIAPHSPTETSLPHKLQPPFWQAGGSTTYLLGTDALGRDVLSRLMFGARYSLIVSLAAIVVGTSFGAALGLIAGYCGGWVDSLIMRATDVMLSLPVILLALLLAVSLGPSFITIIIIVAAVLWARYARIIRGEVLYWKTQDFVALARVAGASGFRIISRHLFPNVLNTLLVLATMQVGWAIIMEGSLSFLGAGVPPPTPSLGSMVSDGRNYIASAWWIAMFPGLAILLIVLSMNLFGDWMRDAFDPKLRQM
ncbi:MAG: ABC transporter permease [Dehalococcoidia bacterium]|nr:ABC transporter permease [Dehalococcoidia bacterium]